MNKVLLGDVAEEVRENYNETDGNPAVVGLEHLIPGEIRLKEWSEDTNTTFTKAFHKGQVLFGRRRAYLKKAAVAPVDGICSGDITVISAKPDKILPELLPFVIQNDDFFDFAVGKSAGSLSPRVKWSRLKEYEFTLPSLPQQRKLAKLLWSFVDAKEAYEDLIRQTDELVKSQFIEMFGNKGYSFCRLSDQCELITKGTTPTTIGYDFTDIGVNFIKIENITEESKFNTDEMMHINDECNIVMKRSQLKEGDILFSIAGAIGRCALVTKDILPANINQALAIIRLKKDAQFSRDFLLATLKSGFIEKQYLKLKRGVAQLNLSLKDVGNFKIPEPPEQEQKKFVELNRQSDKSKFELNEAIKDLDAMYKRIIKDNLG